MKAGIWDRKSWNEPEDFRIFRVRRDIWASPVRDYEQPFVTLEIPDWVNVVAVTEDHQVVCIRQWRVGSNAVELEIPGGVIDSTDRDPLEAGLRELREETGYIGGQATLLGCVHANPAIQNNLCHTVFVEGCHRGGEQSFDPGEEIEVILIPLSDLKDVLMTGEIRHSLVVVALQQFLLLHGERLLRGG